MPIHYAQPPKEQTELSKEEMDKIYQRGTPTQLQLPKLNLKKEQKYYLVDFNKVTKTDEILLLIASLGIVIGEENPLYPQLEHLLIKDQPIKQSDLNR